MLLQTPMLCVGINFHLLWVNTKELNCWFRPRGESLCAVLRSQRASEAAAPSRTPSRDVVSTSRPSPSPALVSVVVSVWLF